MRWLPEATTVEYAGRAAADFETVVFAGEIADGTRRDVPVHVEVKDREGGIVCRAVITMWVSPRPRP